MPQGDNTIGKTCAHSIGTREGHELDPSVHLGVVVYHPYPPRIWGSIGGFLVLVSLHEKKLKMSCLLILVITIL